MVLLVFVLFFLRRQLFFPNMWLSPELVYLKLNSDVDFHSLLPTGL